jgi:hypothetical protein
MSPSAADSRIASNAFPRNPLVTYSVPLFAIGVGITLSVMPPHSQISAPVFRSLPHTRRVALVIICWLPFTSIINGVDHEDFSSRLTFHPTLSVLLSSATRNGLRPIRQVCCPQATCHSEMSLAIVARTRYFPFLALQERHHSQRIDTELSMPLLLLSVSSSAPPSLAHCPPHACFLHEKGTTVLRDHIGLR